MNLYLVPINDMDEQKKINKNKNKNKKKKNYNIQQGK
jgi:hypothetical protein